MDTQNFKEKLTEEKKLLEGELSALGIENPEDHDWGSILGGLEAGDKADDNTAADRFEEFGERSATLGELEIRYNNIKDALKKIEDGAYGICEKGDHEIEKDRLEANPSARTCKEHME